MTRVPTLATHSLMTSRAMDLQSRIYDLQTQLSTEKKSQTYSGISSDAFRLVNFENESARTSAFITANQVANTRLSAMSTSVDSSRDSLVNFRDELNNFLGRDLSTMDDQEISDFKALQDRAFNIMKDVESYMDLKIDGQYVFAGGKTNTAPVNIPYNSVEDYQKVYDGNTVTAPESRFTHMNNTVVTSGDTGNVTFSSAGTITAANAGAFNLQSYTNADTGAVDFDATNGQIRATTAGAFNNVQAGMMIKVSGTTTADDRFYTVSSVSPDGRTLNVEPDISTDITGTAAATITVPAIQPGPITIAGSNTNNRTYTVTDISADGRTLTVTPPPVNETLNAPSDLEVSNAIYYQGGETVTEHRVDDTRSVEFGINAKDGAIEKAFRAIGMVIQGLPTDGSGNVDGGELRRRLDTALSTVNDALEHENANTSESTQDFSRLQNLLATNQVTLNSAISSQKTYVSFLATRTTDMENCDKTEVAVRLNDDATALQVSYATLNVIQQMSLLNYMSS